MSWHKKQQQVQPSLKDCSSGSLYRFRSSLTGKDYAEEWKGHADKIWAEETHKTPQYTNYKK